MCSWIVTGCKVPFADKYELPVSVNDVGREAGRAVRRDINSQWVVVQHGSLKIHLRRAYQYSILQRGIQNSLN
jgi:hypothetical protein